MSLTMALSSSPGAEHCGPSTETDHGPLRLLADLVRRLLFRAVRLELVDIGPEVRDLAGVLDAAEGHAGARNHRGRVVDVVRERGLAPSDVGGLVGIRIV